MKKLPPLLISATPEQLETAKARLLATALTASSKAGATLDKIIPNFKNVVDALPNLRPSLRLAPEVRVLLLAALYKTGVVIPKEVWETLHMTTYKSVVEASVVDLGDKHE